MTTRLLQALFTLCILIGNTNAWASNTKDVTKLKEHYFKNFGLHFTPLQSELLYYCSPNHKDRQKVIKAIDRNPSGSNYPQIHTYLTLFSDDLHDRIVNEILTVFESGETDKIKNFLDYLGIEDMDNFFDFNANKLTREGLKIFDPFSNLFSEQGIKRRNKAKELEEEYMRRHEPFLVTREKQLQQANERLCVKEAEIAAREAEIAKLYAKMLADTEESRRMHEKVINTHAALLRKEEELRLNWTQKEAELMRKECDLQARENILRLADAKVVETAKIKKTAADKKLLADFCMVNYCDSDDDSSTVKKTSGKKATSKRLKSDLSQADAGLRSNMCRAYSRDFPRDFPDESYERVIN
jgi:hypothetical protein